MKSAKALALSAVFVALGLVGCTNNNVVECDVDDQVQLDSDCGYWRNSQFVWYGWVVKGKVSYSPKGFETIADDDTAPADSGGSGHKSKPKKTRR